MRDTFKKRFFTSLAIGLGGFIVLVVVTLLVGQNISLRGKHIQADRQEIEARVLAIESFTELKENFKNARSYFSVLENILPEQDQLFSFPNELKSFAEQYQLKLDLNFQTQIASTDTEPGYVTFGLTAKGSLDNILKFLKSLKTYRYFLKLNRVDLTHSQDSYSLIADGQVFSR